MKAFLKELLLILLVLAMTILEFVSKQVILPEVVSNIIEWSVVALPLILLVLYAGKIFRYVKNLQLAKLISIKVHLIPLLLSITILFITYLRIYEHFYYVSEFQNLILKYGNLLQLLGLMSLFISLYISKNKKWDPIFDVVLAITGRYRLPLWIEAIGTLLKWSWRHKKQSVSAVLVYTGLFFFFNWFVTVEVKGPQVITDSVQDSNLDRAEEVKKIRVSLYAPRDPSFIWSKNKIKMNKSSLGISFEENPFDLDRKEKLEDIFEIRPLIAGKWNKQSDSYISFEPEELFEPGQKYSLKIISSKLRKNIKLSWEENDFQLQDFYGSIEQLKFYVNPKDASEKKMVAHMRFNYPIEKKSLKKNVQFIVRNRKGKLLERLSGKVILNKTGTMGYVHSDNIKLGKKDKYVTVELDRGVESRYPIKATQNQEEKEKIVPSKYSFMNIDINKLGIKYDKEDIPYHAINIDSNIPLKSENLQQNLDVFHLPERISPEILEYLQALHGKNRSSCLYKNTIGQWVVRWNRCIKNVDTRLERLLEKMEYEFVTGKFIDPTKFEIKFNTQVGDTYLIRLNKGFTSKQGYVLNSDLVTITEAPSFPKEVKLATDGVILSLNGSRKLSVYTRGLTQLNIEIRQLLGNQIQHLLTLSNADKKNPDFGYYSNFNFENITKKIEKSIPLSFDLKRGGYTTVDFSRYLESFDLGTQNYGIFYVRLLDEEKREYSSRLMILSDMAYIMKKAEDKMRHMFVISNSSGKPKSNVAVKLVFKNGLTKEMCRTNDQGYCKFPNEDIAGSGLILQSGRDLLFTKFDDYSNQVNYSRFDVGGEYSYGDEFKAYLFSDRKLYRPGEDGHLGIIVKDKRWKNKYRGELVQLEILDAKGKIFKTEDLRISQDGFLTTNFAFPYTAVTGEYRANLYRYNEWKRRVYISHTILKVQEFLPDKMKISAKFNKSWDKKWVKPKDLKGLVTLRNLYGTPAAGNKISAEMILSPSRVRLTGFGDYTFYDESILDQSKTEDLGELKTDESGNAKFDLDLEKYENNSFQMKFRAEGFMKSGGRSVVAENSLMISPRDFLVGIKKSGNLNFLTKKNTKSVSLVAVNNEGKTIAVSNLKLAIYEKIYQNSLVKQADGTYAYQDVKEPTLYKKLDLVLQANPLKVMLDNSKVGEFIAKIEDVNGTVLNQFEYNVVGEADLARSLYRNAELKMTLDKEDYKPGDIVNISLKAPYVGSGLITIERENIYAQKWFRLESPTSVVKIALPKNLEGNAYINIALLRSKNSQRVFTSPFSYGVLPITIDKSRRKREIELDAPYEVKPGDKVAIKYRSNKKGKIIVYAVDEGILQLASYKTPDPLGYFFKKQALQVSTFQLFSLVLPEIEMVKKAFAAGGGAGALKGRNLNPFKRKFTKAVAFWSGIVDAGPKWKTFNVKIPSHFNGTLKAFAVFVDRDAVGVTKRNILSKDNVIITPTIPTFVAPGDKLKLSATFANNLPGNASEDEFELSLKTGKGLKVVGGKPVKLKIKKQMDEVARFEVEATNNPGNTEVQFIATYPGGKTIYTENISVRPHTPFIRRSWRKMLSQGRALISIDTDNYFKEFFEFNLSLTKGYWALIKGSIRNLATYPYGCTEQVTSKAVPYLYFDPSELELPESEVSSYLQNVFQILLGRQLQNGGFTLYPGGKPASDFVNLYVTKFLIKAKQQEFPVPKVLLQRSLEYLESLSKKSADVIRAQALYLMAVNERQVSQDALELSSRNPKNDLVNLYLAGTFKIMQNEKKALDHLSRVDHKYSNFDYIDNSYFDYYSTASFSRSYIEVISNHFPDQVNAKLDKLVESIIEGLESSGHNSLWSAQTLMALEKLAEEKSAQNIPITVKFKKDSDQTVMSQDLPGLESKARKITGFEFDIKDKKKYFFSLDINGFNTKLPRFNRGLQIAKRVLDEAGKEVKSAKVGEELIVELSIQAKKSMQNAVIVDLLPGGFDLVWKEWERGSFEDSKTPDFIEKREDRVIIYTPLDDQLHKFYYKMKAVGTGAFILPAIYAENMYKTKQQGLGATAKINIKE